MACRYLRIASFAELSELVESKFPPWRLDGPNGFDWMYPNSISQEHEHGLYVDYVRDVTDTTGARVWTVPFSPTPFPSRYQTPESVKLVRFLSSAGALSVKGLVEIVSAWRQFELVQETDRGELHDLIAESLNRLEQMHCGAVEEAAVTVRPGTAGRLAVPLTRILLDWAELVQAPVPTAALRAWWRPVFSMLQPIMPPESSESEAVLRILFCRASPRSDSWRDQALATNFSGSSPRPSRTIASRLSVARNQV
ncbi:MAG: hypothetical protein OXH76_15415 [Boseongicola sp.]|nr:hypothetical protein [Boseongicola sp.]